MCWRCDEGRKAARFAARTSDAIQPMSEREAERLLEEMVKAAREATLCHVCNRRPATSGLLCQRCVTQAVGRLVLSDLAPALRAGLALAKAPGLFDGWRYSA